MRLFKKRKTGVFESYRPLKGGHLEGVVNTHDVTIFKEPFRFTVIDNFFTESYYEKLVADYQKVMDRGFSEESDRTKLARFGGYDAYGYTPDPKVKDSFEIFRAKEWQQYFGKLFNVEFTYDEITSLHHHKTGSADGWIHSDYMICSFVDDPLENGVNAWHHQCVYENSFPSHQDTKQVVRALTLIYYLNNEGEGKHGGGTAIYDKDHRVSTVVEPINNRMLVFEVSPFSNHGFFSNVKYPRSTITQWFHQDQDVIANRFSSDFLHW